MPLPLPSCGDGALDAGVQACGAGVGDRVGEVGSSPGSWRFSVLAASMFGFSWEWVAQEVPAFERLGAPAAALVGPEVAQVLLDRPGASGLQVRGALRVEAVRVTCGQVLVRVQPQVLRAGQALVAGRAKAWSFCLRRWARLYIR